MAWRYPARILAGVLALSCCWHEAAQGADVRLRDGRVLSGQARLDADGGISVGAARVELADVDQAQFDDAPPATRPAPSTRPAIWLGRDIGETSAPGNHAFEGVRLTITESARGLRGEKGAFDNLYYVYQPLTGNVQFVARVLTWDRNVFAKVGLMVRQSLQSNAPCVLLVRGSPEGGRGPGDLTFLLARAGPAGQLESAGVAERPVFTRVWLKLERIGSKVTGYESTDGRNWKQIGQAVLPLDADEGFIGIAAATSLSSRQGTSILDGVQLAAGPLREEPVAQPAGIVLRGGSILAGKIVSADDSAIALCAARIR